MSVRHLFILFVSFLLLGAQVGLSAEISEKRKVELLLEEIARSEGTFIRNGKEHSATEARDHLEHKYKWVTEGFLFFSKGKKVTAEEFIEKLASSSSTTGEIYKIRLKDGKVLPTGQWLREKLANIESAQVPAQKKATAEGENGP